MSEIIHYPEHMIGPDPGQMGWEDEPVWVSDQLDRMPNPFLAETTYYSAIAAAAAEEPHKDIMPWVLEERALGKRLRAHYQARGTCVSQAWARAVQLTNLVDMVIHGEGEEWLARVHCGSIYAFSRVEIGGGRIRGDGSLGAWAAQAVRKYGCLYRIKYDGYDLSGDSDETYAVEWATPGRGVPNELEPAARQRIIEDTSLVTSGDQYVASQRQWKFVPICSQQGFTTSRDKYGMCYPRGKWSHCMLGAGLLLIKHPQHPHGLLTAPIWQSWGQNNPAGNDRVTLETGEEITLPPGVFLVDLDVVDSRMLPARDSFGLSGSKGWTAPLSDDAKQKLWLPTAA